ncbi:MAG TPA: CBS domain-containing protein [Acetobacteraceae bacterium]|nr:CBS domain-containing protein [Acetobacteraceae bacterium]
MLAQDVMTSSVLTVTPDTKLADAAHRMLDAHISGLPVVDEAGKLVGVLTEGDLLRRCETDTEAHRSGWIDLLLGPGRLASEYVRAHARTVRDVMSENPLTVTEDTPLADVVKLMERRHIKRVPVMRGAAMVGVVSRADIVRLLVKRLDEQPTAAGDDVAIRDAVCAELSHARWANAHNVTVDVRKGVVTLEGVLFNEALRPALRVAAENAPGVVRVEDHMVWVEPVTGAALGA